MLLTLALSRTIVRAYAAPHKSVTEALSCANNMIVAESGSAISGMFLTLFLPDRTRRMEAFFTPMQATIFLCSGDDGGNGI